MFENASLKIPNSHLMIKVTCRDRYIPGAKIYKSNDTNSTWSTFEDFNDGHLWIYRVLFDHQNRRQKQKITADASVVQSSSNTACWYEVRSERAF